MNQSIEPQNKKLQFEIMAETGTLSYESTRKYFSILGLAIFGFSISSMVAQLGLAFIIGMVARAFAPWLLSEEIPYALLNYALSFIPLYCVGLPVFLSIVKRLPKIKPLKQKMGGARTLGGLAICVCLMISGSLVSNSVMTFFENLKGETIANPIESATTSAPWWINLIFVAILAPILEEILYRKLICTRLLPLGEGWAVVISAAIFSLAHGNFYQCFYAFTLGLFFGFIYVKTGRLFYSMLYHAIINFMGGVISPLLLQIIEGISPGLYDKMMSGSMDWFTELTVEQQTSFALAYMAMMLYSLFMYGFAIAGVIILIIATVKKKVRLEGGLIPPVKEGRFSAFFLNVGVALSIAYFAYTFIVSLI